MGRSLPQWDCVELGRKLAADGVVESISPQTVARILNDHRLKPWRRHLWLSPEVPRDAAFAARVEHTVDLYSLPKVRKNRISRKKRRHPQINRTATSDCPIISRESPRGRG
jgi:hypothetical protein